MKTLIAILFASLPSFVLAQQNPPATPTDAGQPAPAVALPADIKAFIERRDGCEHFLGEERSDAERAAFIDENLRKLCAGSDAELTHLRSKHAGNPGALQALSPYQPGVNAEHPSMILQTPGFIVAIEDTCEEGTVVCDVMYYTGISKKNGSSMHLKGTTIHTSCDDGSCRVLGYAFKSGKISYDVSSDGHLLVKQGEKVLVDEAGTWE